MGRCLSPCLGDLDPNLYRRRLEEALRLFLGDTDGRERLIAHVESQMWVAARERRYERAESLRRRCRRIQAVLERLGGMLAATHARPRLLLAQHPIEDRFDAFWLVAGRLVDWGPLPDSDEELGVRTREALRRGGRTDELGAHVPPSEVDEVRIVAGWLASHPDTPALALSPCPDTESLVRFARPSASGAPALN
jgi:DNA polymerase-3 subunit epsilon